MPMQIIGQQTTRLAVGGKSGQREGPGGGSGVE